MRDIKFRALKDDVSDCRFYYGDLVYDVNKVPRIYDLDSGAVHTCIKFTEGQYTGLKDKNGKEIYEGDIVCGHTEVNGEPVPVSELRGNAVQFRNGCFVWKGEPLGWDFDMEEHPEEWPTELWAVVIGNIWENPELLYEQ